VIPEPPVYKTGSSYEKRVYIPIQAAPKKVDPRFLEQYLGVGRTVPAKVTIDGYTFTFNSKGVLNHSLTKDEEYANIRADFVDKQPRAYLLNMCSLMRLRNFRTPLMVKLRNEPQNTFVLVQKYKDTCIHSYKVELTHVLRTRKIDGSSVVLPHYAEIIKPITMADDTFVWTPYLENSRYIVYQVQKICNPLTTGSLINSRTFSDGSHFYQFGKWVMFTESGESTRYISSTLIDKLETKMALEKMSPSWIQKFKYYCRKYAEDLGFVLNLKDMMCLFKILCNKNKEVSDLHATIYANSDLYSTYNDLLDFKTKFTVPKVVMDVVKKGAEKIAEKLGEKVPSLSVINKRIQGVLKEKNFNHSSWVNLLKDVLLCDREVLIEDLSGAMYAALKYVKVLREGVSRGLKTLEGCIEDIQYTINEEFVRFYNTYKVVNNQEALLSVFTEESSDTLSDFL